VNVLVCGAMFYFGEEGITEIKIFKKYDNFMNGLEFPKSVCFWKRRA
jgi:hypothetical protein